MIPMESPGYHRAAALTVCIGLMIAHAMLYLPLMPDDSFISFQYALRFSEGLGLTWTSGARPVEGYSNFLWVILLSASHSLGVDIIHAARFWGVICMCSVLGALFAVTHRIGELNREQHQANIAAALLFLSCGTSAAWAVGGLEQALLAALLAWGLLGIYRTLLVPQKGTLLSIIAFALLALVRPDTPLFGVMAGILVLLRYNSTLEPLSYPLRLIVWTLVAFAALVTFRLVYYGDYVPNTAHVKLSLSTHYLTQGLRYVARGLGLHFLPTLSLMAFSYVAVVFSYRRGRALVTVGLACSWTVYLIVMGGDVNPPSRHFVPIAVLGAFAAGDLFYWIKTQAPRSWVKELKWLIPVLAVLHLSLQVLDAELRDASFPRKFTQQDALQVGNTLRVAFAEKNPLVAVDGAGAVPYASGLRSLDLLGLNDWEIARTPPSDFGKGWLGHELGSVPYILDRAPDLILFGSYLGEWDGAYVGGKSLVSHPEFQKRYTKVLLQHPDSKITGAPFYSKVWMRTAGVLGVDRGPRRITIPAYLFQTPAPAHTLGTGKVVREFYGNESFDVFVPAGSWKLETSPKTPENSFVFTSNGQSKLTVNDDKSHSTIQANLYASESVLIEKVFLIRE